MSDTSITYRGIVYPNDCDHMGHMNVAAYMEKFDNATWNFFADNGLSRVYLEKHQIGLAAVNQNITYKRELQAGDVITIRSELLELAGKKVRFQSIMLNSETEEVVAEIVNLAVCLNMSLRKACEFPAEIVEMAAISLKAKLK